MSIHIGPLPMCMAEAVRISNLCSSPRFCKPTDLILLFISRMESARLRLIRPECLRSGASQDKEDIPVLGVVWCGFRANSGYSDSFQGHYFNTEFTKIGTQPLFLWSKPPLGRTFLRVQAANQGHLSGLTTPANCRLYPIHLPTPLSYPCRHSDPPPCRRR